MNARAIRSHMARSLGGLAYLGCLLQWLWLAVIVLPPFIESGMFDSYAEPSTSAPNFSLPTISEPSPAMIALVAIATVFMLAVTAIILWRLPGTVAKTGDKLIQSTAEAALPVVTHHAKLPKKRRRVLSARLALLFQLLGVFLPFVAVLFVPATQELPKDIISLVAAGLAFAVVTLFSSSYLLRPTLK